MATLKLNSPLQYVKGVGPRKAKALSDHKLNTVNDLLWYFPRQYLDRTMIIPISDLKVDQTVTIVGQVKAHGVLHGKRRRYEIILGDRTGAVSLLWFRGVHYWQRLFKKNQWYAATGTVGYFQGFQIIHPDLEHLEDESDQMIHAGRIIPVYPQTSDLNKIGLNSKGIRRITTFIFENLREQIADPLPQAEKQRLHLLGLHEAVEHIHYPTNRNQIESCRRRLAFDELLEFQAMVLNRRMEKEITIKKHHYTESGDTINKFVKSLPFNLTIGQNNAIDEIINDLGQERSMARMLQGDVGCGKTVVAILAGLHAVKNRIQTAFMAPTEILAEQHFHNWQLPLEEAGVRCALLTSSMSKTEKDKIAHDCNQGEIGILFGTHALIYDYVSFKRLGLVIIDEQHRFGVKQRDKLHAKGDNPDLLVMTATPIPRTLALTLYGDLDITTIPDMPPGRKPVQTVWRTHDVAEKVYQFVREEINKGGQAYFIYPLIDKSEQLNLSSVEEAYKELSNNQFSNLKVGMVHGRIKPKDRDKILNQFHDGKLDVLMATTVVEVGIDNPKATLMVIEHGERFGLAQLHQLRGRIGRGEKQSTLVAMAYPPISDMAHRRLDYFTQTTDGFKIAEADLELRGPGELYGLKQSGLPELRTARLSSDYDLLEAARELLEYLFSANKNLDTTYQNLYTYLQQSIMTRELTLGGG
ncbi:MAG: ATP-dependent DNA helicase RecG [candidate division Zixibacteria bacterium]|nr:ATP-dependent DNA helicase RecG [candidate division Zixibacteria bacterium]